nr:unnamed protein product [Digitaria exilis]
MQKPMAMEHALDDDLMESFSANRGHGQGQPRRPTTMPVDAGHRGATWPRSTVTVTHGGSRRVAGLPEPGAKRCNGEPATRPRKRPLEAQARHDPSFYPKPKIPRPNLIRHMKNRVLLDPNLTRPHAGANTVRLPRRPPTAATKGQNRQPTLSRRL